MYCYGNGQSMLSILTSKIKKYTSNVGWPTVVKVKEYGVKYKTKDVTITFIST